VVADCGDIHRIILCGEKYQNQQGFLFRAKFGIIEKAC